MRRHAFSRASASFDEPIGTLNITPLIDVLLVLLVMMILTIPIMAHKIPVDLPVGEGTAQETTTHRLSFDADGALRWDGAALTDAALAARLAALKADPGGQLEIGAEAATRYDRFAQILAVVKRAGVNKLAFAGNERFAGLAAAQRSTPRPYPR